MKLFNGYSRTVALPVLVILFPIGWLLYLIGFCFLQANWTGGLNIDENVSRTDPVLIPFYYILIGGPLVSILGIIHAALPGLCSTILGSIFVFPTTTFIACGSFVATESVWNIMMTRTLQNDYVRPVQPAAFLLLVGVLIQGCALLIVQTLSIFYKYESTHWTHIVPKPQTTRQCHRPFIDSPGKARKFALLHTFLSAINWIVYIRWLPNWYTFHGVILVGGLMFFAMLLHAGWTEGASNVGGVFASILSILYVSAMYASLRSAYYICPDDTCGDFEISNLTIAAILSTISVALTIYLWPFFLKYSSETTESSRQLLQAGRLNTDYGTVGNQHSEA